MTDPVIKSVKVPCGAAEAFAVFVTKTTAWWPRDKHSVSAGAGEAAKSVTIEPRVGGAVYEIKFDGTRTEWGKVTDYDEGRSFAMTWHPGSNAEAPTRVEVVFDDLPGGGAEVTLTHSGWEVWADKADEMRGGYNDGWDIVLGKCFVPACG